MKLCNMAYQEFNRYTMDRMSVHITKDISIYTDKLRFLSNSESSYIDTLDYMAKPYRNKLKPIRFCAERSFGVRTIVEPLYRKHKVVTTPHNVNSLIHWYGFLYALSEIQRILERKGSPTKTLRRMISKGDEDNDY